MGTQRLAIFFLLRKPLHHNNIEYISISSNLFYEPYILLILNTKM